MQVKNYIQTIFLVSTLALFSGCTKERPYEQVDGKFENVSKSVIDTSSDYLFVQSTVESDRLSASTRPFWMGGEKRVRLQFSETALEIVEMEKDDRFGDNPTNNKPVMSIPIKHLGYQCAADSYGKCTNREEANNNVDWNQKDQFAVKGSDLANLQLDFMPIAIGNFFGNCYQELSSDLIKSSFEADAINLQVEKTFLKSASCTDFTNFEELSELTFTVRYHYSMVKLDQLTTPDYQPIAYTRADETSFGFFYSKTKKLDSDNNDIIGNESHFLNRWNPNKSVDFHLSENFLKPQNAKILKATKSAVESINAGLGKSGAKLKINLKNPVVGMDSGDLRNNMIVLVEDPQASGIIGYGPSAKNPLTGEIVHARTVMYLGTIKKYVKYSYDDIVRDRLTAKANKKAKKQAAAAAGNANASASIEVPEAMKVDRNNLNSLGQMLEHLNPAHTHKHQEAHSASLDFVDGSIDVKAIEDLVMNPMAKVDTQINLQSQLDRFSSVNAYSAELFNFEAAIGGEVDAVIDAVGLKPWAALSAAEKEMVIDVLLPHVWVPTLIHEFGHNLGLRHNFASSEDNANFYTKDEAESLGLAKIPQYSSVMDYAYRTTNELRVMGKYDVAALRYGYAEEVELEDGKIVPLAQFRGMPEAKLKAYRYCTDEHVSVNPTCNRFDEGSTLSEIALHNVTSYEKRFSRSNFRNGRRKFSLYNDPAYARSVHGRMMQMRLMFERYETIKNSFGIADNHPAWESIPFLKDLKQGVQIAAGFLVDVLTTPGTSCVVLDLSKFQLAGVVPIRAVSSSAVSCFDSSIQLKDPYLIIGEAGKSFASRKDPRIPNPYVDQIDVRGIWVDKLLATHHLFGRRMGSSTFDKFTDNFLDIGPLQGALLAITQSVINNEVVRPVTLRTIFGNLQVNMGLSFYSSNVAQNSHRILKPLSSKMGKMMDLPSRNTNFQKEFLKALVESVDESADNGLAKALAGTLKVITDMPSNGRTIRDYLIYDVGADRFLTLKQEGGMAADLMKNAIGAQLLAEFGKEKLAYIATCVETSLSGNFPAFDEKCIGDQSQLPIYHKAKSRAKQAGIKTLKKALGGELQESPYYAMMIETLAELTEEL